MDEGKINVDNFDKLFKLYNESKFVLQAPALSAYCHMMPGAVVFMRRPVEEIVQSQERIGLSGNNEMKKYFRSEGVISQIKYEVWETWQNKPLLRKSKVNNMFELDYHSIEEHPFYVANELRKDFKPKQTELS